MAGYHLYFLDENRTRGGHVLDFRMSHGEIRIGTITELHLSTPDTASFRDAHLTAADRAEQIRKTEGGH